ncbi:MAG: histidine--tRNA ligase [Chlamydiae bacterium]|nr:histidine--tRNA ligase [Chlamydiota bacterium]
MFHRVKGSYDIIPESDETWKESSLWHHFEKTARLLSSLYGFKEIRTPVFEHTDVFTRSAGEESDVISKEMYTFFDKSERSLSLRPELTAPIVRAFIENNLHQKECDRFFYMGPCFRYDRMQKGRYRQFHQFGVELFAPKDPYLDAETIYFLLELYKELGLKNTSLKINSIGDKEIRENFSSALKTHFAPFFNNLSSDSQRRFHTNPLRILDSKDPSDREICKNAPKIEEFLTPAKTTFFKDVLKILDSLKVSYEIDQTLVRGLDYYCDTVFEVVSTSDLGAQNALGGGGRYDGLMKEMGGQDLPGFGFATGIERILLSMSSEGSTIREKEGPLYYFIPLSPPSKEVCFKLMTHLRKQKKSSLCFSKNYTLKKGLAEASKVHATYAVLVGEEEMSTNTATVKCLETRVEKKIPLSNLDRVSEIFHA